MAVLVAVETAALLLMAVLVAGLLRSHAEIMRVLHRLGAGLDDDAAAGPVDVPFSVRPGVTAPATRGGGAAGGAGTADGATPAHDLAGMTPHDEATAVGVVGSPRNTLLAFLSSGCQTCAGFWEEFGRDGLAVPGGARLVVVTKGADEESVSALRRLDAGRVPLVMSSQAWADYAVPGSPYFVYVDGRTGTVAGEGAAGSWPQVASLMAQAAEDAGAMGDGRNDGAHREARADRELLAAGITPGHPSLYGEDS